MIAPGSPTVPGGSAAGPPSCGAGSGRARARAAIRRRGAEVVAVEDQQVPRAGQDRIARKYILVTLQTLRGRSKKDSRVSAVRRLLPERLTRLWTWHAAARVVGRDALQDALPRVRRGTSGISICWSASASIRATVAQ